MTHKCFYENTPLKTYTFNNVGSSIQSIFIPSYVSLIHIQIAGSKGGSSNNSVAGLGGLVECDVEVIPFTTYGIVIGNHVNTQRTPGWPGGGTAAADAKGGGGYSAFLSNTDFPNSENLIVVAGAGGGTMVNLVGKGGNGGGLVGGPGGNNASTGAGAGGTQSNGGALNGGFLQGGSGGSSAGGTTPGAGGGGYYGGGLGRTVGSGSHGGAGGGGSSWTHPDLCINVVHTQGANLNNGYCIITFL